MKKTLNRFLRPVLFIAGMLCLTAGKTQDLNIDQTIEYINKKINDHKASVDVNAKFVWELSPEGKLTITQYVNEEWNFSQSVYLKALDKNKVFINDENIDQETYFFTINVRCKDENTDVIKKYKRYARSSSIFIRIAPDEKCANQLKNAIGYLITLGEAKTEYKSKDTDPFDYSKY